MRWKANASVLALLFWRPVRVWIARFKIRRAALRPRVIVTGHQYGWEFGLPT